MLRRSKLCQNAYYANSGYAGIPPPPPTPPFYDGTFVMKNKIKYIHIIMIQDIFVIASYQTTHTKGIRGRGTKKSTRTLKTPHEHSTSCIPT